MPVTSDIGSLLEVRGQRWRLTGRIPYESCTVLTLEGVASARLRVIDPFDRPRVAASASLVRRARRSTLRAALTAATGAHRRDGLWTAASASMDLWPYQLEPALAAIGGTTRLLLADDVGLGKTIQAGLLLSELLARGWIERALIVCPAGLRDTWARELAARFHLHARVVDQASVAQRIAELPPGVNPWGGQAITIASIDFIKRPEVIAALQSEPIDVLIADEAHHLSPGTDRGAAVSRLASRSPWCVLLSATPHSGDEDAFAYLTNVGSHGERIAIFRRRRSDVGLPVRRRTHLLAVTASHEERLLFAALDRYTRTIWRERGREDGSVRLIATTLARRAASSQAAIQRTLLRRRDLLAAREHVAMQPSLPWEEDDTADDIEPDAILAVPGMQDTTAEVDALSHLIELARRCVGGSKLHRLSRLIARLGEPVVVFTEYRDTLDATERALRGHRRIGSIHGGIAIDLRRSIVDAFNGGELDVLVATDAAGEGLNLHHRCRLVIDLELPWNPLRLEQRIGRVDRLGQQRTVHAVRLFHRQSIEETVLERLQLRHRRAAAALCAQPVSEISIANSVFDDAPLRACEVTAIGSSRVPAATDEAARIELHRRATSLGTAPDGIAWSTGRRDCGRFVLLHRKSFLSDDGAVICDELHAHRVTMLVANRREQRIAIIAASRRLHDVIASAPLVDTSTLGGRPRQLTQRIETIRRAVQSTRIETQPSIFDRRADDARTARDDAASRLDAALVRLQRALAVPSNQRVRVKLVAAWPERDR